MNFRIKKQHILNLFPNSVVMTHGPRDNPARYLTFDDGPDPRYTPRLLDLLMNFGLNASFFLVGRLAEDHPNIVQRIVDEGHILGNHSYNHKLFAKLPLRDQIAEIERTDRFLQTFDGRERHWIRPPQGHLPLPLMMYFVRCRRSIAYWSYDSHDYALHEGSDVVERMRLNPPRPREIILMHDDGTCAIDALGMILPQWIQEGYVFSTLPLLPK